MLSDQFILRGVPDSIRSDNGPELVAKRVREWIKEGASFWSASAGAGMRYATDLHDKSGRSRGECDC